MADAASTTTSSTVSTNKAATKELTLWGKAWWLFKKLFKVLVILLFIWLFYSMAVLNKLTSMNSFICLYTLPVYSIKVNQRLNEYESAINSLNIRLAALDKQPINILSLSPLNITNSDLGLKEDTKQSFQNSRKSKFTPNAYMNELQRFKEMDLTQQQQYLQMSQEEKRKKYQL